MATCQKQRTGTWSAIFPPEQVTELQSTLFVKKLLAVAVSNITYLRTVFPEHAFGDRCLEDLNLKILRDDSSCPGACQVIRWVKGCFDALDKKYLQSIVIGIYNDASNPETVIESYTFKFSYGDGAGMDIYRNGSKLAGAYSEAETRKATIKLLRTIVVLTQTLKPLPDDVTMTMRLLYFDDVTPSDYQPPGFVSSDGDELRNITDSVNIAVGDVATVGACTGVLCACTASAHPRPPLFPLPPSSSPSLLPPPPVPPPPPLAYVVLPQQPFHMVKLRIQTAASQFELPPSEDPPPSQQDPDVGPPTQGPPPTTGVTSPKESEVVVHMDVSATEPQEEAGQLPDGRGTSLVVEETADAISTPTAADGNGVRCPCGFNEDDGLMILCGVCGVWQHGVCFGLLEEEEVPQVHICEKCAQADESGHLQCTDPFLQFLAGLSLQTTCLFRRALLAASEVDKLTPTDLTKRLGVERTVAQGLLNRLEREGFVSSARGRRVTRMVLKEKLAQGMERFMLRKAKAAGLEDMGQGDKREVEEKGPSVEQITQVASSLSLEGRGQPRAKELVMEEEHSIRRSPRLAKRARAVDQDAEFDLACSQDWGDGGERPQRRRKVSVANKPIMV